MPRFPLRDAPFIIAARMFAEPIRRSEMCLFMLRPEPHSSFAHDVRTINGITTKVLTIQRRSPRLYLEIYLDRSKCAFFQAKIENNDVSYEVLLRGHPYDLIRRRKKSPVFKDLFKELELVWFTWSKFLIKYSQGNDPLFILSGRKRGSREFERLGGSILHEKIDWRRGTITLPVPDQDDAGRGGEPPPTEVWTVFVSYVGDPDRAAERERREMQEILFHWLVDHMRRFPKETSTLTTMFTLAQGEFPSVKLALFKRAWATALATISRSDPATRWGRSGRRQGFQVQRPAEQQRP